MLAAIVDVIRLAIPELSTPEACYVSDYPQPPANVSGNLFCQVSATDGEFPEDLQAGAGENNLQEYAGVVVTVWSKIKLDRTGKTEALVLDPNRGMLAIKKKILTALKPQNLVDPDGYWLLTNFLMPRSCSAPRYDEKFDGGTMALHFSTDFAWSLE